MLIQWYCRDLKVADARKMLTDTLKWREDFKITEVVKEEFPQDIFGNLGRVYGKDKEGHPIVYVASLRPLLVPLSACIPGSLFAGMLMPELDVQV